MFPFDVRYFRRLKNMEEDDDEEEVEVEEEEESMMSCWRLSLLSIRLISILSVSNCNVIDRFGFIYRPSLIETCIDVGWIDSPSLSSELSFALFSLLSLTLLSLTLDWLWHAVVLKSVLSLTPCCLWLSVVAPDIWCQWTHARPMSLGANWLSAAVAAD